ncbi:MAG: patatin-like phospholipase family protein [Eubacteriaceae bacterium]|nr:patatin-like phospholipase family protein [Eubacteriaceae bacterium]
MKIFRKIPSFGIAFSGGGTKGFAEIGAWKALEDADIPLANMVAGSSTGSMVAACYALGISSWQAYEYALKAASAMQKAKSSPSAVAALPEFAGNEIRGRLLGIKPSSIMVSIQRDSVALEQICEGLFGASTFDQAKTRLIVVACDLNSGNEVYLSSGKISSACRASSSRPGQFSPTAYGSMLLADAGASNNLPADILKKRGIKVVLGINVDNEKFAPPKSSAITDIASAYSNLAAHQAKVRNRAMCDVLIEPGLDIIENGSQSLLQDFFDAGYEAMKSKMPALKDALGIKAPKKRMPFF